MRFSLLLVSTRCSNRSENEFEINMTIGNLLDKSTTVIRDTSTSVLQGKATAPLCLKLAKVSLNDERLQCPTATSLCDLLLSDINEHIATSISYLLDYVGASKALQPLPTLDENRNEQQMDITRSIRLNCKDSASLMVSMNKVVQCPLKLLLHVHPSESNESSVTDDPVVINALIIGLLKPANDDSYAVKVKLRQKLSTKVCLFPSAFEWTLPNVRIR
jgi:hypothetical protein